MAATIARGRRWRRWLGALVVVGVVAGIGLVAVSQTATFREWVRREVVTRANQALAGRLTVGGLDGNLFGRLVARDVRLVLEDRRVLAIRRATATYDLFALLGGGLRIETLEIDGAALLLLADERGWNLDRLSATPAEETSSSLEVSVERFALAGAALRVVTPGRAWRFRGVTLDGSARFGPRETRIAIDRLSSTEHGTGLRLEADGRAVLVPGRGWSVEGIRLRTAGSQIDLAGRFEDDVDLHLEVPRLAATELRALLEPAAPRNDIAGRIDATGPRDAVAVTGEVRVVAAEGSGGRARLDGTVDLRAAPKGTLVADLEGLDLAAIVGPDVPATDLTGRVEVATLADAADAFRFDVDLREPRVDATTVPALRATGDVRGRTVQVRVDATAATGAARVTATIDAAAERFDATVTTHDLDVAPLVNRPELAGRLNAELVVAGTGFAAATSAMRATLTVTPSRVGNVVVGAGDVGLRTEAGRLYVERAHVATDAVTVDAAGDMALVTDAAARTGGVRGDVRATDLGRLAALFGIRDVGGVATATVEARGSIEVVDATVGISARALRGADWRVETVDLRLEGRRLGTAEGSATFTGRGRNATLGERQLTEIVLDGSWQGASTPGRGGLEIRARESRGTHRLTAAITREADTTRVALSELRLALDADTWTLVGKPELVQRGDRVTIAGFTLRSDRGAVTAAGTIGRSGANDLTLVVDGLDLEALAGLVPPEVRGRLAGEARLTGTVAAPRFEADVALQSPTLGDMRYDELRGRVELSGDRAQVEGRLAQAADRVMVFDGAVPLRFALVPWRFEIGDALGGRLRSDGVDLAFLGALWPELVTKVSGTLTADLALGGTVRAPEARGTVAITGGRAHVVPLGLRYDPVELALRLDGRAASIDRLVIQSGTGRLEGGGDARLGAEGAEMRAQFEVKSFPLFANEYGKGAASGWLWISGSTAAPVLEGYVETDGLVLQIPEVLPSASRPPDPTIVVIGPSAPPAPAPTPAVKKAEAATPPAPGIFERAAITVQVSVPRNAWVRRSDANVELQGWMTAWKKPDDELHLAGDIRGVRGWYAFQGKKFDLEEGGVRFTGQGFDPVLDIKATHKAGEYLVRLRVGGTITKPSLALESEPSLDQADVLAVLLFGAPASGLSRSQSAGLREQALGIAGGYVASELRQSVANALGVDDLQFDAGSEGLRDASVSVGKYVANDIFVSLAHRFGDQSVEEVRIEYVIRPGWSLETSTDTLGRSGVDLFWKRRY